MSTEKLLLTVIEERDRARALLARRDPISRDDVVQAIEHHLKGLKCSQWGRSFSVSQPRDRAALAEHLADTLVLPVLTAVG